MKQLSWRVNTIIISIDEKIILQGKYKEAGEYFNRAYNISRALGETSSIQVNRVQSGIAQAHSMLRQFSAHVVQGDRTCLHRIIEWKNVRQNLFNDVIPDPSKNGH